MRHILSTPPLPLRPLPLPVSPRHPPSAIGRLRPWSAHARSSRMVSAAPPVALRSLVSSTSLSTRLVTGNGVAHLVCTV
eukprot:scaffold90704_cov26-Tisochrysis_lutea.AAC.1